MFEECLALLKVFWCLSFADQPALRDPEEQKDTSRISVPSAPAFLVFPHTAFQVLPDSNIRFRHVLPSRSPKWPRSFQLLLYRSHHLMRSKSLHTLNSMFLCPLACCSVTSNSCDPFLYETWLLSALPAALPSCLHLSNWTHAPPTTTGTPGPELPCTKRNAIIG
ncbi:hypothetical protein DPMN_110138 [Dreissena polymorpha]|uniref:Secreted protein n=1 Tax=Dreissena polymorpha TaxID=45954 RepID=A0A9D4KC13_DREPO|nr:hypothetical protein DPMN_110138 [Dreissena polymorpha]